MKTDELSCEELASKTEAGSSDCFNELVRRHSKPLMAFVNQRVRHRQDAEDLVQDTFIRAYAKIHLFDKKFSFKTWLFTIAARLASSYHRNHVDVPVEDIEIIDANDPASLLAQQEAEQNLWDRTRRLLPRNQSTALWLRYAENLSVKQISKQMGNSEVYIKVLLHRGRTALLEEIVRNRTNGGVSL